MPSKRGQNIPKRHIHAFVDDVYLVIFLEQVLNIDQSTVFEQVKVPSFIVLVTFVPFDSVETM